MKQHQIDLLPATIRARSQAGVRTGRYATSMLVGLTIVIVLAAHSRIGLERSLGQYEAARKQADQVLETETRIAAIENEIEDIDEIVERYRSIAHPIEVSRLLATVVNRIPEGMTIDRLDLDTGARIVGRRTRRAKRSASGDDAATRLLNGELAGFAPDDNAIATFVSELQDLAPLDSVSLDFSRTRMVHERSARAFRLSFRVDFERLYEVASTNEDGAMEGGDDAR